MTIKWIYTIKTQNQQYLHGPSEEQVDRKSVV